MLTTTKGWNPWWGKGGGQDSSKTECSTAWAGGRVSGWVGAWAGHCLISQNDRFCHRFLNQSVSPYMAQVHRYSRWVFCTGCDYAFGLADFFAWGGHDGEPATCQPTAGNQGLWWEPSKFQNCLLHISQTLHTITYFSNTILGQFLAERRNYKKPAFIRQTFHIDIWRTFMILSRHILRAPEKEKKRD